MRSRVASLVAAIAVTAFACEAEQPPPASARQEVTAKATKTDKEPGTKASETAPEPSGPTPNEVVLDHSMKLLDGGDKSLADYRGKTLLVVNTASECAFTPQYADLQKLHATYAARGLEVLAFPSDDFGGQEPGTPEQIREFVNSEYAVEFEMFDKVVIKGENKSPLYETLTEDTGEGIKGEINWNFTKFLVDPQGRVVRRFEPPVTPMDEAVTAAIEQLLPEA